MKKHSKLSPGVRVGLQFSIVVVHRSACLPLTGHSLREGKRPLGVAHVEGEQRRARMWKGIGEAAVQSARSAVVVSLVEEDGLECVRRRADARVMTSRY